MNVFSIFMFSLLLPVFAAADFCEENHLPFKRAEKAIRECFSQKLSGSLYIRPLNGGYYRASHFSLIYKNIDYHLELFNLEEPEASVRLQLLMTYQAALFGVGPSVHYLSHKDRVIITD